MTLADTKGETDLFARIRAHYGDMSRTQRRIADYFMEHADVACFQSLKEAAAAAHTTEAMVLKFCGRIGCDGFLQFKRELQGYVKLLMSPNEKIGFRIRTVQDDRQLFERIIEMEKQCLELTYHSLPRAHLEAFIAAIRDARQVWVVGHRVSEPVAQYLTVRLQQVGVRAAMMDIRDLYATEQAAVHASKEDLFVIISFPYYAPQTRALVEYLGQAGIPMVCITDRYSAPIAAHASAVLVCNSEHEVFYNTITAAISLVSVIASCLVLTDPERFAAYREKLEQFDIGYLKDERRYQDEQNAAQYRHIFKSDKLPLEI